MALKFWFTGIARGSEGLWRYLIARVHARTAVELEHERDAATASALRLLPPGAELLEYERNGRLRVIRMPDRPAAQPPTVMHDVQPEPQRELP